MPEASAHLSLRDGQGRDHRVAAVIFDKDGTLLDFHASWDAAVGAVLDELTGDDETARTGAAQILGYDLIERRVLPGSPIIAESNEHIIELVRPIVGHLVSGDLTAHFNLLIAEIGTTMVAAAEGAAELLQFLSSCGVPIGLATNDAEAVANAQLAHLGWHDHFSAVVGYDSGYGAKPDPGMVIGCAERMGVDPLRCLMVGDSTHDLLAGSAAGAQSVLIGDIRPEGSPADAHFQNLAGMHAALVVA